MADAAGTTPPNPKPTSRDNPSASGSKDASPEDSLQSLLARSERELHTSLQDESVGELPDPLARVYPAKPQAQQKTPDATERWNRWSQMKHALVSGSVFGGPKVRHLPPAPPPPSHRPPRHLPPPPTPPASSNTSETAPPAGGKVPQREESEETDKIRKVVRGGVSPIHTLQQDLNRVLRSGNLSVAKIAALEEERRAHPKEPAQQPTPQAGWRTRDYVLLGISALLVGGGLLGAWFAWKALAPPPPITRSPDRVLPQFFEPDVTIRYELPTPATRAVVMRDMQKIRDASQLSLGSIAAVYVLKREGEGARPLSAGEWFSLLNAHLPEQLRGTLESPFMLGFHGYSGKPPYLVLRVRSLENGIRGMLDWEPFVVGDLAPLFGEPLPPQKQDLEFKDATVRNNDVRLLRDGDRELMVYGFVDRSHLIITTNTVTYYEILSRIRRAQLVAPEGGMR